MDSFNNVIWNYKNFNMANELDIAGEFIYDGIQKLNEMSYIEESASLFSFLYHISVGIERLQKTILVLCDRITIDSYENFEKDLITHSHTELSLRISKFSGDKLNNQENDFMQVLTKFYKKARYNRFNVMPYNCEEEKLLTEHINKYLDKKKIQYHFYTGKIVVDDYIKEYIGRLVGNLSKKYYSFLKEKAIENNTYSYELRVYSKAESIFLSNNRKNSLQELKITEKTVFKEFLIYLRNSQHSSSILRYIDKIKPLDIDVVFINEYISELTSGTVPGSLIDEVETLYEESGYSIDRVRDVGAIGDTDVDFDIGDIFDCIQQIEDTLAGFNNAEKFSDEFPEFISEIDNDEITAEFNNVLILCDKFSKAQITKDIFIDSLQTMLSELKSTYNL